MTGETLEVRSNYIMAEMLKISKSGCCGPLLVHYSVKSSCWTSGMLPILNYVPKIAEYFFNEGIPNKIWLNLKIWSTLNTEQ